MRNEQYTSANGETYVLGEDFSRDGFRRPVVIQVKTEREGRGGGSNPGFYQSRSWPNRNDPPFGSYEGYVPQWYRKLRKHKVDRMKLIGITAIVSPIVVAKLPLLFQLLFQP
jgi:hypothetical protein